jgi:hypothetical protein
VDEVVGSVDRCVSLGYLFGLVRNCGEFFGFLGEFVPVPSCDAHSA